jgi:hypothetical protein
MYKVIIKYRPEYNAPIRIEEAEDIDEAYDLVDEAEQQFGVGIVLNQEEFKELREKINQNKEK